VRDGDDGDETTVRLIRRVILVAKYRRYARRYPDHAGGFLKMAKRHSAAATALMVKVIGREAEAPRPCPRCGER